MVAAPVPSIEIGTQPLMPTPLVPPVQPVPPASPPHAPISDTRQAPPLAPPPGTLIQSNGVDQVQLSAQAVQATQNSQSPPAPGPQPAPAETPDQAVNQSESPTPPPMNAANVPLSPVNGLVPPGQNINLIA